jgi:hypothetical protein
MRVRNPVSRRGEIRQRFGRATWHNDIRVYPPATVQVNAQSSSDTG